MATIPTLPLTPNNSYVATGTLVLDGETGESFFALSQLVPGCYLFTFCQIGSYTCDTQIGGAYFILSSAPDPIEISYVSVFGDCVDTGVFPNNTVKVLVPFRLTDFLYAENTFADPQTIQWFIYKM